jgi:hypothetical protein
LAEHDSRRATGRPGSDERLPGEIPSRLRNHPDGYTYRIDHTVSDVNADSDSFIDRNTHGHCDGHRRSDSHAHPISHHVAVGNCHSDRVTDTDIVTDVAADHYAHWITDTVRYDYRDCDCDDNADHDTDSDSLAHANNYARTDQPLGEG